MPNGNPSKQAPLQGSIANISPIITELRSRSPIIMKPANVTTIGQMNVKAKPIAMPNRTAASLFAPIFACPRIMAR